MTRKQCIRRPQARHTIERMRSPRLFSLVASYDVASNIGDALPCGGPKAAVVGLPAMICTTSMRLNRILFAAGPFQDGRAQTRCLVMPCFKTSFLELTSIT